MNDRAMQIAFILDRSGSMQSIEEATVEGTNAFLAEQKKGAPALSPNAAASPNLDTQLHLDVSLRFVQFDDKYETVYSGPISMAPHLTLNTQPADGQVRFQPRGSTALVYAIGRTVDELGKTLEAIPEPERPAKVVVVIMTDGFENASHTFVGADKKPLYDMAKIAKMIRVQRDAYNWQFQFLGANQDAIATAAQMNIPNANAISYAASARGTRNAMQAASRNVAGYGATGQSASVCYVAEDRARAMEDDEQETPKA